MNFKAARTAACLALLFAAARVQAEENGLVAVLPLNAPKLDKDLRETLEEDIRTVAGDYLRSRGYRVLTGETTLQYAEDNGLDPTKVCEASCALKAARELKATLFISGSATQAEDEYVAFVRLYDTKSQQQLGSVKLEGAKVKDLRGQFEQKADELFQAVGQGSAPPVISGTTPAATLTSEPPPQVTATAPRVKKGKVTAAVGTLTVAAKPKELVRIDIEDPDGKKTSSGIPYENPAAKPGTYKITAKASGYGDETQTIVIAPDDVTLVKFDLKLLGKLSIQGTPQGAAVSVTGPEGFHDDGGIPWEAEGLHAGSYSIHVSRQGYADANETGEVKPGETATVQIALQKATEAPARTDDETGRHHARDDGSTFAPAPISEKYNAFLLGLPIVYSSVGGGMLEWNLGIEYRFIKQLSFFVGVGLGLTDFSASSPSMGLSYTLGLHWFIVAGLYIGPLFHGWYGSTLGSGNTSSDGYSVYEVGGDLGYLLEFGSDFNLGIGVRLGYTPAHAAAVSGSPITPGSAAAASTVNYGIALVPGFSF